MRVVITGATGLIGSAVTSALRDRGEAVIALTRDEQSGRQRLGDGVEVYAWPRPTEEPPPPPALRGADAVIHLLGEPIAQRWSAAVKQRIRESRELSTRLLVQALGQLPDEARPRTLVSQSATGYYGPRDDRALDEQAPSGTDFVADVVVAWEQEALGASERCRVVLTRTGVVLSPSGGALGKMLPFFRLGVGGPVAGGRQYVPWIHLDDVVGAVLHCLDDERISGPVNVTSPRPVTNSVLSRALGHVLHRPAVLPVPSFALNLLYGEMATIVITGQRAVPQVLVQHGYEFRYPELADALSELLR
jgi:uncharacterized protein (TIGR01777 family)